VTASKTAPNLELLKTTIKMATNLFEDFVRLAQSNGNKKRFELKGADYNETLIWNSQKTLR
jgi:methylmalonyl-CoA mutase